MPNELTWRPRYRRALGLSFESLQHTEIGKRDLHGVDKSHIGLDSNPKGGMNKCRQLMQATLFRDLGGFVLSSTACVHYTLMISTSSYVIFVIQIGFVVYSAF